MGRCPDPAGTTSWALHLSNPLLKPFSIILVYNNITTPRTIMNAQCRGSLERPREYFLKKKAFSCALCLLMDQLHVIYVSASLNQTALWAVRQQMELNSSHKSAKSLNRRSVNQHFEPLAVIIVFALLATVQHKP